MDSLDELRDDLWARWREAFDRFAELTLASQLGERVVYANVPLFNLKKYSPSKFPVGGRVLKEPPKENYSSRVYRLDSKGRPVHMACRHEINKVDWHGLYCYTDDDVEYIEFCLQTDVVSEYGRMTLSEGLPATFQHIDINGGGAHLGGRAGRNAIDYISKDTRNYWMDVEEYCASGSRIVSGTAMVEGLGLAPRRSTLAYSYSDKGRLSRIERIFEDGWKSTEYAARSKSSMKELAARLSEKIASRVVEALKKAHDDSPLVAVELSYRSVTNYVPGVIASTERDSIKSPVLNTAIDPGRWLSLNHEDFEPEMAEFTERLHTTEQWDLGTRMLRQAALRVTKLARESLQIAESFVSFAIDWEFEGQDLQAILKQCGADAATLRKLKSIGWLD